MRRTFAAGSSTILLIVLALLASRAGFAVASPGHARAVLGATFVPDASVMGRPHGLSSESDDAPRTAFVRPAPPSITRSQAPVPGGSGHLRGLVALHALPAHRERVAAHVPVTVEARRDGVTSPGQPAPASRAPPVG